MLPGYTGGKLLWVKDNEPGIYQQGARFLLPKDYLRYRLTGDYATDVSDASGTGLFDVAQRQWADALIDRLDLPRDWFPVAHESGEFVGTVSASAAAETGLKAGTPVIAGGGDAIMQTVGSGSVDSRIVLLVTGTAGNVTVSVPSAITNPGGKLQVFCHAVPDQWAAMGVTLAAGSSLKWFRDTLGGLEVALAKDLPQGVYDLLNAEAETSPAGANGLIFLPYLQGERAPHTDVNARGAFIGLGLYSKRADMIRAIMEGVTFSLRDVLALIQASGITPEEVRSSGGGAASPIWRQIQAGVFNRVVTTITQSEGGSALGAGIVAGVAAGMWPSAADAVSLLTTATRDEPAAADAATYEALFAIYQGLYPALKPSFDALAARHADD
jgi:xylulokinase